MIRMYKLKPPHLPLQPARRSAAAASSFRPTTVPKLLQTHAMNDRVAPEEPARRAVQVVRAEEASYT
jgi:hypothetical protein